MQTIYRTHLDALHQWINEINSYLKDVTDKGQD